MDNISHLPFALDDYKRYGRQMVLDGFGISAQLKLQRASVVVVGAGGIGCPALQYLAAAGVGRIGIIDHDTVEISNLQRQILHNEETIGMYKTDSAAKAILRNNSRIKVDIMTEAISPSNVTNFLKDYDVVLDCTDNVPSRYLLNDACVQLGKPLVSGGAERYGGQVCIYNFGEDGPCLRCRFPNPPPPAGGCQQTGVLGIVTGIIGNIQALQAIKVIIGLHARVVSLLPPRMFQLPEHEPTLIYFTALGFPLFQNYKLDPKVPGCPACGKEGERIDEIRDINYVQWCGVPPDWVDTGLAYGEAEERIYVQDFKQILDEHSPDQLNVIDVRSPIEFEICHLPNTINVPLDDVVANPGKYLPKNNTVTTYFLCRLGNDSMTAANALRTFDRENGANNMSIKDLIGGLRAWTRKVDPEFPEY